MNARRCTVRQNLEVDLERWILELQGDGPIRSTLELGIGLKAVRGTEELLQHAIQVLLPGEEVPAKPTFGQLVDFLRVRGRRRRMECSGRPRKLLTLSEFDTFSRMTRARNQLAHGEGLAIELRDIRSLVEAARAVVELALFDELECEEANRGTRLTATHEVSLP